MSHTPMRNLHARAGLRHRQNFESRVYQFVRKLPYQHSTQKRLLAVYDVTAMVWPFWQVSGLIPASAQGSRGASA